jgi:hypothetical protein
MAVSEISGGLWHIEPLWGELEELLGRPFALFGGGLGEGGAEGDAQAGGPSERSTKWHWNYQDHPMKQTGKPIQRRERQQQGGRKEQGSALARVAYGGRGERGGKIRPGCAWMHKAEPYAMRVDHVRDRGGGAKSTSAGCHSASQRIKRHRTVAL